MIDIHDLFRDLELFIATTAKNSFRVSMAMVPWIDYCRRNSPQHESVWRLIDSLDFESDFQSLTEWIQDLQAKCPVPASVNFIRFGLWNPSSDQGGSLQFYLAGECGFNPADPYAELPGRPQYFFPECYASSSVLPRIYSLVNIGLRDEPDNVSYLGESWLGHGYLASVVSRWCVTELSDQFFHSTSARSVAIGHDAGDNYFIRLSVLPP